MHFGQNNNFSGLICPKSKLFKNLSKNIFIIYWPLPCFQNSNFVTATNSHCLHLNVLTFPWEFTRGTRTYCKKMKWVKLVKLGQNKIALLHVIQQSYACNHWLVSVVCPSRQSLQWYGRGWRIWYKTKQLFIFTSASSRSSGVQLCSSFKCFTYTLSDWNCDTILFLLFWNWLIWRNIGPWRQNGNVRSW